MANTSPRDQVEDSHDHISATLEVMETDILNLHQRLDYLGTKKSQVDEELDHIIDTLKESLQHRKDELASELAQHYVEERQRLLIDIRDKEARAAETKEGLNQLRTLMREDTRAALELALALEEKPLIEDSHEGVDDAPRLMDLNLKVNFDELTGIVARLPLGDIDAVYSDQGVHPLKRYLSSSTIEHSFEHSGEPCRSKSFEVKLIHSKVEGDASDPKLNDIAVVGIGKTKAIVVTDRENRCVKAFYKKGELPFFSRLSTNARPRGLTYLGKNQVATTLPENKTIRILKITPAIKKDRDIKTSKGYRGIALLDQDTLVVSTYTTFPGSVDIIDFKGSIIRSISKDSEGNPLFNYPFYLSTTPQHRIVVSDCERKCITCLTEAGNVIFKYGEEREGIIKYPTGVAVDTSGDILVADCDSNRVVRLGASGEIVDKELLGGGEMIVGPHGVDVDADGAIYVAQWNGDIKVCTPYHNNCMN